MLFSFDTGDGGMQLTEHMTWLPDVGINYDMGVDGISVWLVVLTTLLSVDLDLCLVRPDQDAGARVLHRDAAA